MATPAIPHLLDAQYQSFDLTVAEADALGTNEQLVQWKNSDRTGRQKMEVNAAEALLGARGVDPATPYIGGFKVKQFFSNRTADRTEGSPAWSSLRASTAYQLFAKEHSEEIKAAMVGSGPGAWQTAAGDLWVEHEEEQEDKKKKHLRTSVDEFVQHAWRSFGAAVFVVTARPGDIPNKIKAHIVDTTQFIEGAPRLTEHESFNTSTMNAIAETFQKIVCLGEEGDRKRRRVERSLVRFQWLQGLPLIFVEENGKQLGAPRIGEVVLDYIRIHLSLASGCGYLLPDVPWTTMGASLSDFFPHQWVTKGFVDTFKCVTSMSVKVLREWIHHVMELEGPAIQQAVESGDSDAPLPKTKFDVPAGRFHLLRGRKPSARARTSVSYVALDIMDGNIETRQPARANKRRRATAKAKKPRQPPKRTTSKRKAKGKVREGEADPDEMDQLADDEEAEEDAWKNTLDTDDGSEDDTSSDDCNSISNATAEDVPVQESIPEQDYEGDEYIEIDDFVEAPSATITNCPLTPTLDPLERAPSNREAPMDVRVGDEFRYLTQLCSEPQWRDMLNRVSSAFSSRAIVHPRRPVEWAYWRNRTGYVTGRMYRNLTAYGKALKWIKAQAAIRNHDQQSVQRFCLAVHAFLGFGAEILVPDGQFARRIEELMDAAQAFMPDGWRVEPVNPLERVKGSSSQRVKTGTPASKRDTTGDGLAPATGDGQAPATGDGLAPDSATGDKHGGAAKSIPDRLPLPLPPVRKSATSKSKLSTKHAPLRRSGRPIHLTKAAVAANLRLASADHDT
ncbi:uncharacterized protein BXZ73DRAFT_104289 [Epithele typhae]|uniref:uncharacterized protein n=1 Tax=Epithele typhae TaxID=378194 RepID=UPI0020077EE9|nr:uncharacterized protein BXZ73DRAFT_104289 [Epithele typhae]KAH9921670.1 hypothetical protein BXZ73DRAFT_104289 [Epithele typhae]